ncbi:hypothetical protein YC2023_079265 [Brassica napus]
MAPIGWRVYGLDREKGRLRFLGHSLVLVELLSLYSTEEDIHMQPTHINLVNQSRDSSLDATLTIFPSQKLFQFLLVYAIPKSEYRPRVIVNGTRTEINLHDQLDVMRPYWELDTDTDTGCQLVNTDELVDVMPNKRLGQPPASLPAIEAVKTVTITEEDLAKVKVCAICKEEFEVGEEGKVLKCLHLYHPSCIESWLNIHNTCHVCRFEVNLGRIPPPDVTFMGIILCVNAFS